MDDKLFGVKHFRIDRWLVKIQQSLLLRELCLEVASELQTLVLPGEFVVYRLSHA